jgi:outer membrane protein OmpA-like peptidoglycan-associated protein
MKTLSALLLAGTALGLASGAHAQQTQGWYLGPEAGWTHMNSPDSDIPCGIINSGPEGCGRIGVTNPADVFSAKMNEGFGAGLALGYQGVGWPGLRLEGEIAVRSNGIKSVTDTTGPLLPPGATFNAKGNITSLAFMANALYDFMPDSQWTPYLGVGIGAARLSLEDAGPAGTSINANATNWQFAYQGIAGVKYAFNPKWSAGLDYRYFATTDPTFSTTVFGIHASAKTQYSTHNVFVNVAYHFGAPTPPPPVQPVVQPPAPPPAAPTRLFIVYFDFDKSNLTTDGGRIVHEAADTFKKTGSAKIMVTGYTDLAGTQQYNLGLSKRRADTVKGALVKEGVPSAAIVEAWRGKENPAVPTPDGVREARNRRVEIVLP